MRLLDEDRMAEASNAARQPGPGMLERQHAPLYEIDAGQAVLGGA